MNTPRTYRRAVMARRGTRADAVTIAAQLQIANPDGEYAVEYTAVALQLEQWRVIRITDVPDGTPDRHSSCEALRKQCAAQIYDMWDNGDVW